MKWYLIKLDINGKPYQRSQAFNEEPILEDGWDAVWTQVQWDEYLNSIPSYSVPENYSDCTSIGQFAYVFNFIPANNYRLWRGAMKDFVIEVGGGSESSGFELQSAVDKAFLATHNIGTGEQRMTCLTDEERDKACFQYLMINEGGSIGLNGNGAIKNIGGVWLKALCFSRLDHIEAIGYGGMSLPTLLFMLLQIESQSPLEISGNILSLYRTQGIDGIALGNPPLGISDFVQSTIGTRYETTGLRTNTTIAQSISANEFGISGFANIDDFADELLYIIKYGKPSYL